MGSTRALPPGVAELMPVVGHIFESKYRIVEPIGAGGYARVYRARFEDVARDVALKILVPQMNHHGMLYPDELIQRFHREARAVSDLRASSTITLHDFGRTSAGLLYMIFEFVDGKPLDILIKTEGAQRPERVMNILTQALESLREAHAVGLLHRDIKPANIMLYDYLDQRDLVKVLDFGIAKNWTHAADGRPILEDLTEDGTVMGTPRYMSPEQIVGQALSPATDIYSLGLVVFEMLTGTPAAPQTTKSGVVRQHLGPEPFYLPQDLAAPNALRAVVERMVAKDLTYRYSSSDEVLAALRGLAGSAVPAPADAQSHVADTVQTGLPKEQTPRFTTEKTSGTPGTGSGPMPMGGAGGQPAPVPAMQGQQLQGGVEQTQPSVAKPGNTFLQVATSAERLTVDVPMHPNKRGMIVAAVTMLMFTIAWIATSFLWLLFIPVLAWGLSLIFRTHHLLISPETGYEVTVRIFGYDQTKRGPMASVVRFQAVGSDEEDNTVLKLITHEGEFVVANAFTDAENQWVAAQGNVWLSTIRAQHPNPVG